ncbi:MAG: polysaccharide deacetylase family protein [Chthoniobacteraceae bacterium]
MCIAFCRIIRLFIVPTLLLTVVLTANANLQQHNLPDSPKKPRFELRDRDWPANPGEASICLWKDDALAAFSIAIDDNNAMNVPWWMEMCKKYDLRPTWFIITNLVEDAKRSQQGGAWELWRKVVAAGYDVQSHTVSHMADAKLPDWKGVDSEYGDSQKVIEKNISGHRCLTLAYPGGKGVNELNDPVVAAKYYIGCRGVCPFANAANQIDYTRVNANSRFDVEGAKFPQVNLSIVFDPSPNNRLWRGWYFGFTHFVKSDEETMEQFEKKFAYVQEKIKNNDLWMALFREGCQYGQERDTAHIEVQERGPAKIVLNLSDDMDDKLFDFPLTLKVRLHPSWKSAEASQSARPIECKIVERNGANYALVQAVPDHGPIVLVPR